MRFEAFVDESGGKLTERGHGRTRRWRRRRRRRRWRSGARCGSRMRRRRCVPRCANAATPRTPRHLLPGAGSATRDPSVPWLARRRAHRDSAHTRVLPAVVAGAPLRGPFTPASGAGAPDAARVAPSYRRASRSLRRSALRAARPSTALCADRRAALRTAVPRGVARTSARGCRRRTTPRRHWPSAPALLSLTRWSAPPARWSANGARWTKTRAERVAWAARAALRTLERAGEVSRPSYTASSGSKCATSRGGVVRRSRRRASGTVRGPRLLLCSCARTDNAVKNRARLSAA